MGAVAKGEGKHPGGRPKDLRPQITLRVSQECFNALDSMQSETGLAAPDNASMLLHMLFRNPEAVAARLRALRSNGQPQG
jgi:hypothetical protein